MELQMLGTALSVFTAAIGIPLAAWRLFKEHQDWAGARAKQMREQFEFADKLMSKISNGDIDPYSKELGLHALAGTLHVQAVEIEYVISLRESPRDLRAYIDGRHYLDSAKVVSHRELAFKARFKSESVRRWRKRGYFGLYMLCFLSAGWPFVWSMLSHTKYSLGEMLISFATLIPLAIIFAKESIDIDRAEALMATVSELNASAGRWGEHNTAEGRTTQPSEQTSAA